MITVNFKYSQLAFYSAGYKANEIRVIDNLIYYNGCAPASKVLKEPYDGIFTPLSLFFEKKGIIKHITFKEGNKLKSKSKQLDLKELVLLYKTKEKYSRHKKFLLFTSEWMKILDRTLEEEINNAAWYFLFKYLFKKKISFYRDSTIYYQGLPNFYNRKDLLTSSYYGQFLKEFLAKSYCHEVVESLSYRIKKPALPLIRRIKYQIYEQMIKNLLLLRREREINYCGLLYEFEFEYNLPEEKNVAH